jgi:hypothetical protein
MTDVVVDFYHYVQHQILNGTLLKVVTKKIGMLGRQNVIIWGSPRRQNITMTNKDSHLIIFKYVSTSMKMSECFRKRKKRSLNSLRCPILHLRI